MRLLVIGASGYLGNTIYKKLKESGNDNIFGTCCKSGNQGLLQVNVLNNFNKYLASLMNIDDNFIIPDYSKEEVYHNLKNDKRKLVLNTIIQDI